MGNRWSNSILTSMKVWNYGLRILEKDLPLIFFRIWWVKKGWKSQQATSIPYLLLILEEIYILRKRVVACSKKMRKTTKRIGNSKLWRNLSCHQNQPHQSYCHNHPNSPSKPKEYSYSKASMLITTKWSSQR